MISLSVNNFDTYSNRNDGAIVFLSPDGSEGQMNFTENTGGTTAKVIKDDMLQQRNTRNSLKSLPALIQIFKVNNTIANMIFDLVSMSITIIVIVMLIRKTLTLRKQLTTGALLEGRRGTWELVL